MGLRRDRGERRGFDTEGESQKQVCDGGDGRWEEGPRERSGFGPDGTGEIRET